MPKKKSGSFSTKKGLEVLRKAGERAKAESKSRKPVGPPPPPGVSNRPMTSRNVRLVGRTRVGGLSGVGRGGGAGGGGGGWMDQIR